jgi:hypothetical protein
MLFGILLSVLYENLYKLIGQRQAVNPHLQISEERVFDFCVATDQIHIVDNPDSLCSLDIFLE